MSPRVRTEMRTDREQKFGAKGNETAIRANGGHRHLLRDRATPEATFNSAGSWCGLPSNLVPHFTEARVSQFLGFWSQMSHLPSLVAARAPAILGTIYSTQLH